MDYLNFDLRLGDWNAHSYTGIAEVLQSPAGQGERYAFLLETEPFAPGERAARSRTLAAQLGQKLTESVFAPSLALWYESYHIARERNRGLRLRLHTDAWELSRLPWELLYDPRKDDFVVFDPIVSLVRYIRLHAVLPTLRQTNMLKLLVAIATPSDQAPLDTAREAGILHEALHALRQDGRIEIAVLEHATHESLRDALLEHAPNVVHFIGHAEFDRENRRGSMVLEDPHGMSYLLGAQDAVRLLRRYGTNLVVLNACETAQGAWAGLAPALVRCDVPAVVSMQWPIEDRAAIAFSRSFYRSLAQGKTIDESVAEARLGISTTTNNPDDWAAPVLFLRSSSGQLWKTPGTPSHPQPINLSQPGPIPVRSGNEPSELAPDGEKLFLFRTYGPLLTPQDDALIVDRPELRRALRIAQQPSVTQYVALLGARQTGKTTLLLRLMHYLRELYGCVFIDMSVLRAQNARACFRFVASRLLNELRAQLDDDVPLPETREIESSVEFLEFLRELAGLVPFPRILLLIDEVGALTPSASDSFYNTVRTVFTQGRGLSDQLAKYLFVFSGAVDLYDLTFGTISPLNICDKIYLQDLSLPDVEQIVNAFAKQLNIPVQEGVGALVYSLTSGHPYLTTKLCALVEQAGATPVSTDAIHAAAEQMLAEDDNIRHMLRKIDQDPQARQRLRSILLEGRQVPFSRNDRVLAALEMYGAIRPAAVCEIRNEIYARALRHYYEQSQADETLITPESEDLDAMYARLHALHAEALASCRTPDEERAWENYAAALFSTMPAFSLYPHGYADFGEHALILAISSDSPEMMYWRPYQPAVWVTCEPACATLSKETVAHITRVAGQHNLRLVFVLLRGAAENQTVFAASGTRENVHIVILPDDEIAELLTTRRDLEPYLRDKVLDARLRQL